MQLEIRLAESGHSYHYSQLTNVHSLMQQIRKDFKIQLEDQKIIMKSGQILKSTMSFDSLREFMKKTLSTNFYPSNSNNNQIKQVQCLYVYNQKQLLKPIQAKNYNQEYFLKMLKQKCKQMALLAQNTYESKNFNEKVIEKSINNALQSVKKRLNTQFEDIVQRYNKFSESLNQRNYTKMQISALLDLIQNQDKARRLLIRNIEYLFDRKSKKRFLSLSQKLGKQIQKQNEQRLKQSSSFFSSNKQSESSEDLENVKKRFKLIEQKYNKFYEKLKQSKRQVTKVKYIQEERTTFNFDKKAASMQKEYDENVKTIKGLFDQFCEQILRVNLLISRTKQKQVKDLGRNLVLIHEKISTFEKKVQDNIKQFTNMFLQLSRIHQKGQSQSIKEVFLVYVELIRSYEQLDVEIKRVEKDLSLYKERKTHIISISQFDQGRNINMPLKKNLKSPKKDQKKNECQQSSISKQSQNEMLKINSPIKKKFNKNNSKLFNQEITSRIFQSQLKNNKQLSRRLHFNKRLQNLIKYCSQICQKEQELRREFRNSKQFQENKIDLLSVLNVPSVEIDFNQTTDVQLVFLYKKCMQQNINFTQSEINWQNQVVECVNSVNKTLNAYLASKSNTSEKEKNIEKILRVMSETFYKMMKKKIEKQIESITKNIQEQFQIKKNVQIQKIQKENEKLSEKLRTFEEQKGQKFTSLNKSSKQIQQNIQKENILLQNEQYRIQRNKDKENNDYLELIEEENSNLRQQIRSLSQKLLSYREQVDQTTQKLIQSYEESHSEELSRINQELKIQKDKNIALTKQIKELKSQIDKAKKNLIRQVQTSETLCKQIEDLEADKEFYQKQFAQLKNLLADKEVAIIKLQKQLQALNGNKSQKEVQQSQQEQKEHDCEFRQEVLVLRQDKESLQQEIQALDKELKEILFKETQDQEIQTQEISNQFFSAVQNQRNDTDYQNQTSKINQNFITKNLNLPFSKADSPYEIEKICPFETKPLNISYPESDLNKQSNPLQIENHIVSKYYISSMAQQWMSTFPSFTPISIGKSIQEGMSHIFLPFGGDIYIGVTVTQQVKKYGNYQEYVAENDNNLNRSKQPIYILDIKEFSHKTAQLIRECSLVLIIRVDKKSQVSMGNKVMVSGKIQLALGFEDDDMRIKNYSHFLHE